MGLFFFLIRFVFKTTLLLIGVLAVVWIFAALFGQNSPGAGGGNIAIGRQSLWPGWLTANPEQRQLYALLQRRAADINTPLSDDPALVTVSVGQGEPATAVATRLQSIDLIQDANLFAQLLRYNGIDTQLQSGDYQLRRNMTMRQIGAALFRGRSAQQVATIFPGWRLEQVAQSLHINGVMDANQFYRVAQRGAHVSHPLLAEKPAGQSYEGYLFPGTYYLLDDPTPQELIEVMLDAMARQLPPNAAELARRQGLTLHQAITLASIVEREAALDRERPIIASVYLNRLRRDGDNAYLQADPTVQYAMGYQADKNQWWKSPVALEEYSQVDSPYNTYLNPGLPPGPIANPRLESILAVLSPAQTDYYFFVCRYPNCAQGEHTFATTYEEHLQNVAAYWGQ
jgi:UPF0755 protein